MEPRPTLDQLIALKAKLEQIIVNQPRRKRQFARQLADLQRQIDEAQGQALLL